MEVFMNKDKYTIDSTLNAILENPAVLEFIKQVAPGMVNSLSLGYVRSLSLQQFSSAAGDDPGLVLALLDVANGREVNYVPKDSKKELPKVIDQDEVVYDLGDIDGQWYMLERNFSGCVVVRFTKPMDETVYGRITCEGKELPRGLIKVIEIAGNMQMLGIPVCEVFEEYDQVYTLHIEGFQDTDGNRMEPQDIKVKTLPKLIPNAAYAKHDEIALQAAREGIVLLKNNENILPINPNSGIHLIGASKFRISAAGAGRINPRYSMVLFRAIEECSNFQLTDDTDTAMIVISRPSGENQDNNPRKGEFYLTDEEETAVREMTAQYKNTIAIINSGYPMDLRWIDKYQVKAAIWCNFSGMLGGKALVETLDGRTNPSGKLPDTWSIDYYDIPASANFYTATKGRQELGTDFSHFVDTYYEEDIYIGYRYFETFQKPVAYPFGFGLSYTSFVIEGKYQENNVNVSIKNIGSVSGKEVVQLYVGIPDGKLEQPSKRLIGFEKTRLLSPGEIQEFIIPVSKDILTSFDEESASWIMEKGSYKLYLGNSVKKLEECGEFVLNQDEIIKKVENLMRTPVKLKTLSKKNPVFPKGLNSGIKEDFTELTPKSVRKHYIETDQNIDDFINKLSVEELARLSVCASHGWGMHQKGAAGKVYSLENYDLPDFVVSDGSNGVNIKKRNIGMPCSNMVCATFNRDLAYHIGRVIAEEAKENDIQMILAPAMNIHRNPLNGRHPEYFSEDPYLAGIMAGYQSKGLEENGVSSCIKHTIANNCESARKRNHSIMSERALREIYLKVFETAISIHKPDSMMTAYNAVNGVFTAEDEEMIQGIFRGEFGFDGYVMTDWTSYDSIDVVAAIQAGNCWMTPGTTDNKYVTPIVNGVKDGKIDEARLRSNIRYLLGIVQKRTGKDLRVKK
jgi:beta-glucosidase